jgi:hypothetical protein
MVIIYTLLCWRTFIFYLLYCVALQDAFLKFLKKFIVCWLLAALVRRHLLYSSVHCIPMLIVLIIIFWILILCDVGWTRPLHSVLRLKDLCLNVHRSPYQLGQNFLYPAEAKIVCLQNTAVEKFILPSKTQHMYINALMKYQLHQGYMFRP